MKYRFLLLLFLCMPSYSVFSQVSIRGDVSVIPEGKINFDEGYQVSWPGERAQSWAARFSPQLEAFPVNIDIPLKGGHSDSGNYQILISFPANAAYAFHLNDISASGNIEIRDPETNALLAGNVGGRNRTFVTGFLRGSQFLFVFASSNEAIAVINRVYVGDPGLTGSRDLGFEGSLECEQNTACSSHPEWQLAAQGVVRIRMVMEEGIGWCTGSLMNNTARDARPFILSAHHCQSTFTPLYENWRFDFGYEAGSCSVPVGEPSFQSLTGCTLRAKGQDSDFLLVELLDTIPVEYNVYWNGWDRREDYEPDTVALIHHPSADIKKISVDYDQTEIFKFNIFWDEGISTPARFHLKSFFDDGTHEGGSSGGPLVDRQGLVVGQLHGGRADCEENFAYSGRVHKSWESGSLENEILGYWLDPLQTGQDTLHGMLHPQLGNTYTVRGHVKDPNGKPLREVLIKVEGALQMELQTDSSGYFSIPVVSRDASITIKPRKNTKVANGVTAIDLLLIQKHLLNIQPFTKSHELLAADVSGNDKVTGTDLVLIQKLLLGINPAFPGRQSWTFDPVAIPLQDVTDQEIVLDIMAVKLGDVNATADENK